MNTYDFPFENNLQVWELKRVLLESINIRIKSVIIHSTFDVKLISQFRFTNQEENY